jgi:alkylated DNA nucleotide flippase Atl1
MTGTRPRGDQDDGRGRRRRAAARHAPAATATVGIDDYASRVLDAVDSIAPGTVMSYGDVAEFVGQGGPRQVGRIMALWGGGVAWWRVVHADGSLLAGHERAALAAYEAEATPLRHPPGGGVPRIDMARARRRG